MAMRYEDYKRDYNNFLREQGRKNEKRNFCVLIAFVLGVVYFCYLLYRFFIMSAILSAESVWASIGVSIGQAMILPHTMCVLLGAVLCGVGWGRKGKWLVLIGAVFYTMAMLVFPRYFPFVVAQIILSYAGFVMMCIPQKKGGNVVRGVIAALCCVVAIAAAVGGWYYMEEYGGGILGGETESQVNAME